MLLSPYSTLSFEASFTGTTTPAEDPTSHRYQQGEFARQTPWFAVPDRERRQQRQQNGGLDSPQTGQSYDPYPAVGPYMSPMTGATYGQSPVQTAPAMYSQQAPNAFSSGNPNPTPENPGPSASYKNSPAAMGYLVQNSGSMQGVIGYNNDVGLKGPTADYPAGEAWRGAGAEVQYQNTFSSSFDPSAHILTHNYPPQAAACLQVQHSPTIYTFIPHQIWAPPSEISSFASLPLAPESGTASQDQQQQRSSHAKQNAPAKKRPSGKKTRRPRKPPPGLVPEPTKSQTGTTETAAIVPMTACSKRSRKKTESPRKELPKQRAAPAAPASGPPGTIFKLIIGRLDSAPSLTTSSSRSNSNSTPVRSPDEEPEVFQNTIEDFGRSQDGGNEQSSNSRCTIQSLDESAVDLLCRNSEAQEVRLENQWVKAENWLLKRQYKDLSLQPTELNRQHTELRRRIVDMKCERLESMSGHGSSVPPARLEQG